MATPYEVLIRNGIHAHIILSPGGPAQPVRAEHWPDIAAAINPAALGTLATIEERHASAVKSLTDQLDAITAEFAAYKANAEAALKAAGEAIENQELNDRDTVATIARIVTETGKPLVQKEIEALEALQAENTAKLAALKA